MCNFVNFELQNTPLEIASPSIVTWTKGAFIWPFVGCLESSRLYSKQFNPLHRSDSCGFSNITTCSEIIKPLAISIYLSSGLNAPIFIAKGAIYMESSRPIFSYCS